MRHDTPSPSQAQHWAPPGRRAGTSRLRRAVDRPAPPVAPPAAPPVAAAPRSRRRLPPATGTSATTASARRSASTSSPAGSAEAAWAWSTRRGTRSCAGRSRSSSSPRPSAVTPDVDPAVRAGGAGRRPAQPPQRGVGVRGGPARRHLLPGDGAGARRQRRGAHPPAGEIRLARGDRHRRRRLPRPGRGPRRLAHPPRRQARQPVAVGGPAAAAPGRSGRRRRSGT